MNLPHPGRGQASESQRRFALLRAGAKFIPPLEAEGFLWLICKVLK